MHEIELKSSKPILVIGQSISLLRRVPIEILSEKHHITWVLVILLFTGEFQMETLAPYFIDYYTSSTSLILWVYTM